MTECGPCSKWSTGLSLHNGKSAQMNKITVSLPVKYRLFGITAKRASGKLLYNYLRLWDIF